MPVEKPACNDLSVGMARNMAREQTPLDVSQSGGARSTVALLAALLLVASVVAPVSTTAAVGSGDPASALASAGNTTTTTAGNDETTTTTTTTTTTAGNDETTTTTTATTTATTTTTTTSTTTTTTAGNDETTTVGNDQSVTIRGTVTADDPATNATNPIANDSVQLRTENGTLADENRTDEEGRYRLWGEPNRSYDLTYRQSGASEGAGGETGAGADGVNETTARDGLPAAYAIGQVNASGSVTRNVSVPAASVLNVTVVAQNRTSVENATVRLTHERDGATAVVAGQTDEQGRLTVDGRIGVEMAGNVTVAVETPNSSLENQTVDVRASDGDAKVVLPLNDTDPPTLRYDVTPNPVNVSESVTFDARNTTDESGVRAVTWTIDGTSREARSVSDDFGERGEYEVTLSATDWARQNNTTTITVTVVDERPPEPALTANATTVETNESVLFDASGTDENDAVRRYWWDFDGDGEFERYTTEPTASHAYDGNANNDENAADDGSMTDGENMTDDGNAADENVTYDATVMVVDAAGNRANATQQVTVTPSPPVASFSVTDLTPGIDQSVTFDASPSTSGAPITTYEWTFEKGPDVQNERSFPTTFSDSGTYNVTLTITDDLGRTAERTRTIRVPNKLPEADARSNESAVVAGESVALDANYSIDPDDEFAVEWNRTAGPNVTLSTATARKPTFTAPNVTETETLRFELTVSDDHGANDTDEVAVVVAPRTRPNVTYAPANPEANETVTFRANRSGQYRWDYDGDGTPEATPDAANVTNLTATHRFDAPGEYNVTLVDAVGRAVVRNVTVTPVNDSAVNGSDIDDSDVNDTDGADGGATGGSQGGAGGGAQGGGTGGSAQGGGAQGGGTGGSTQGGGAQSGGTSATGDQSEDETGANGDGPSDDSASGDEQDAGFSATVTVEPAREESAQDRVLASVENAAPGEPATVELPDGFGGNGSAFESVAVVADGASNFSLSVAASSDRPTKAPRPGANGVLSYLEVEERNATVTSAQFGFRVAADRLAEAGVSPDAVRLYRYHGDEWETLATAVVGKQNGGFRFRAVSPGFSVFAIGFEDGSGSNATQQEADGDEQTGGDGGGEDANDGDADSSDQRDRSDRPTSQNTGGFGGVGDGTLIVGLFCAAIIGAALWGYLLS